MVSLRCSTTGVLVSAIAVGLTVAQAATPTATTSAAQQTHTISVGNGDHKFRPDVTQAEVGDIIEFDFYPVNHSVVRAEYLYPCIPREMTGKDKAGFFSGFHPVDAILSNPPKWTIKINDSDPIFFYCSAKGSCIDYQMVGVINPNANVSLAVQKQYAGNSSFMLQPGEPFPAEASVLPSGATRTSSSASSTSTPTPSSTSSILAATTTAAAVVAPSKAALSSGAIAGIVVAGVAFIALAAALFFFIGRSKSLKEAVDRQPVTMLPQSPAPMYQHHSYLAPKLDTMTNASSRNSAVAMPAYMVHEQPVEYHPYVAADETFYSRSATRSPEGDGRQAVVSATNVPARHPSVLLNPDNPQEKDASYK